MMMPEKAWIEQVVEKVVSEVLESYLPQLRTELIRRVVEEVTPQLGAAPDSSSASLLKAISSIQTGTTQREILRSLLDNTVRYSGRTALFVVKAGAATGWQGRAFSNHEDVKDFALDVNSGVAARALQSRMVFAGSASEMDPRFMSHFGAPADERVLLLPLLLKERVAALVYADAGAGGKMDQAALELLVASASAWLEVASSRKQSQKEGAPEAGIADKPQAAVPAQTSSFSDPFAAHTPAHSAPLTANIPEEVTAAGMIAEAASASATGTAAAVATDPFAAMSPEDAEIHRKAQRFARLLVDEIKLYNQAKVAEGRKNRDMYDRLRDDIDKSRATYQKRYGGTVAASAEYLNQELIRSLAEDDSSLMGANFQR